MSDLNEPTYEDRYFAHLGVIMEAQRRRDRACAIEHSLQCMPMLPLALAQAAANPSLRTRRFSVLPFEVLCEMLPVFLADSDLSKCIQTARACHQWCSSDYVGLAQNAIVACSDLRVAYAHIEANPGCLQTEVKRIYPSSSDYLYWANHLGYLRREKAGRTFRLHLQEKPSGFVDYRRLRPLADSPLSAGEAEQLYLDSLQRDVDNRIQRAEYEQEMLASKRKNGRSTRAAAASPGCLLLWLAGALAFGLLSLSWL